MGIISKKPNFSVCISNGMITFLYRENGKKNRGFISYISKDLVLYFEYQHRENTTIRGITILCSLHSVLLLLIFCFAFTATLILLFSLSSFHFLSLLSCLLIKGTNWFIQSPSASIYLYFTVCPVLLPKTEYIDSNCECNRFLHMDWNLDHVGSKVHWCS